MTKADLTKVTPESNKFCTEWWEREQMYNDGPYTPYGAKGVTRRLQRHDRRRQLGRHRVQSAARLRLRQHQQPRDARPDGAGPAKPGQYRNELAYTRFWDDNNYPCQAPPWGELVAVNANTGDIAWKVPLGIYPELVAKGIPPTGTPNLGGPIATASGLVFIGATKDRRFRAFDAKTGKELWYAELEAQAAATPMTFMGKNGTQYVVVAAGGPGDTDRGGTEQYPQKLVAFALSDRTTTTADAACRETAKRCRGGARATTHGRRLPPSPPPRRRSPKARRSPRRSVRSVTASSRKPLMAARWRVGRQSSMK